MPSAALSPSRCSALLNPEQRPASPWRRHLRHAHYLGPAHPKRRRCRTAQVPRFPPPLARAARGCDRCSARLLGCGAAAMYGRCLACHVPSPRHLPPAAPPAEPPRRPRRRAPRPRRARTCSTVGETGRRRRRPMGWTVGRVWRASPVPGSRLPDWLLTLIDTASNGEEAL